MIEYYRGPYGANLLFRWHGSALAKAFIPGLLSVGIYLALRYAAPALEEGEDEYLNHPYAVGVLVSSVSFLIIFRANYGYQRYWEACTMVHKLMSKWMDASAFAGVFHLQSELYKGMHPPSFFDHDELNKLHLTRDREGEAAYSVHHGHLASERSQQQYNPPMSPSSSQADQVEDCARSSSAMMEMSERSTRSLRRRRYIKSINETRETRGYRRTESDAAAETIDETQLLGPPRLDGGWGMLYPHEINGKDTATYYDLPGAGTKRPIPDGRGFASTVGGRTPSLFLQELAHLSSLLCAVALTTLRNDLDDVESPLDVYVPGQPYPEADPGHMPKETKRKAYEHRRFRRNMRYLLGMDQTKRSRTIYNAARPMLVLGGVSDNEIAFLQRARGPYAKTQLVWGWLSDFIIREHLAGSMGKVGPPIVSRIVQFMSDGILYYNHARKIMFTPFPFPHAQLSAFFVLTMVLAIPFLMDQYANEAWLGAVLSFLTVTCLSGLHEVARELENPFRNAPNDVPLCTLLAFYNEALVTMFAGHHPDAYWDKADVLRKKGDLGGEMEEGEEETGSKRAAADAGESSGSGSNPNDKDDHPPLIPELPAGQSNGTRRPATASEVPQSTVDDADLSLKELREMVDSQANKIRELQERVQRRGRPTTAPS